MSKVRTAASVEVTMREFRAAPAKVLRRAARAHLRLRVGGFVLSVETAPDAAREVRVHGCMKGKGRVVGDPERLLSADDDWSADA